MKSSNGYLYVANHQKFINEAIISAGSLKRFNQEPVCLICPKNLQTDDLKSYFDFIIANSEIENHTYLSKVIGLQCSPFDRTVFLDTDTFITDTISELFEVLDLVDFATTTEATLHTDKSLNLAYRFVFPEFNTGVIVYNNNSIMQNIFSDWLTYCLTNKKVMDMPGLREAVLLHINDVKFSILPDHYNAHGFKTMLLLFTKVKIIHERLEFPKKSLTPHFQNFEYMEQFSKRINRISSKRVYVPKLGVIPYNWNPLSIILYIKKKLGYKKAYKSNHEKLIP